VIDPAIRERGAPVLVAERATAARAPVPAERRPSLAERIARRLAADVRGIRPALLLVQGLVALIPRATFGWVRPALYRATGVRIGARTRIYGKVQVEGVGPVASRVRIGTDCMFTTPLFLNASADIRIGNHVVIGHHAMIITDDHELSDPTQRCGARVASPVVVEDGVWIAARVTVLPGVTLGHGSVIAAGALVARDVPPHTLVAGVPARVIKRLSPDRELRGAPGHACVPRTASAEARRGEGR
jgi:acetyltransferase-like isoleucine patch superfamily enzyme